MEGVDGVVHDENEAKKREFERLGLMGGEEYQFRDLFSNFRRLESGRII